MGQELQFRPCFKGFTIIILLNYHCKQDSLLLLALSITTTVNYHTDDRPDLGQGV